MERENYLTMVEVAKKLRVSRQTVINQVKLGMPQHSFAKRRLYLISEVIAWMDKQKDEVINNG